MQGDVQHSYTFKVESSESNQQNDLGSLYFTAETYSANIIPNECTQGIYTYKSGKTTARSYPLVSIAVHQNGGEDPVLGGFYGD